MVLCPSEIYGRISFCWILCKSKDSMSAAGERNDSCGHAGSMQLAVRSSFIVCESYREQCLAPAGFLGPCSRAVQSRRAGCCKSCWRPAGHLFLSLNVSSLIWPALQHLGYSGPTYGSQHIWLGDASCSSESMHILRLCRGLNPCKTAVHESTRAKPVQQPLLQCFARQLHSIEKVAFPRCSHAVLSADAGSESSACPHTDSAIWGSCIPSSCFSTEHGVETSSEDECRDAIGRLLVFSCSRHTGGFRSHAENELREVAKYITCGIAVSAEPSKCREMQSNFTINWSIKVLLAFSFEQYCFLSDWWVIDGSLFCQVALDAGLQPSVVWQMPAYLILSSSEVLVSTTGLQFAYTQASSDIKALSINDSQLRIPALISTSWEKGVLLMKW